MTRRTIAAIVLASFAGPAPAQNAADAHYEPADMAAARAALKISHGGQVNSLILGERLEYRFGDGDALAAWQGQGWLGGDLHKLWIKTEGDYDADDDRLDEAEIQALYSRAISPFWDLQAGIRHDVEPDPSRTYAVIGMQGLAPYWFEVDSALFLSDEGDLSARVEVDYELLLTQRLVLQPRIEVNASFSADAAIGRGSGLSGAEAGLRLRYEFTRAIAPYLGVSWNGAFGETRDFVRAAGEDPRRLFWVAGLRFWF